MRPTRFGALLCATVVMVLAAPANADGPGKLIASASDSGVYYASTSLSRDIRRPQKIWAVVTVDPSAVADFRYHVSCEKAHDFDYQSGGQDVIGSAVISLPRPVRKPLSCDVDIDANYDNFDSELQETVTIELRATKQRR